jgi:hypothetical protein
VEILTIKLKNKLMLVEKQFLLPLVEKFINNNCVSSIELDDDKCKIKAYLKKDENYCFSIFDKDNSIKCVFDDIFLKHYLSNLPSYTSIDHFDGKYTFFYFRVNHPN